MMIDDTNEDADKENQIIDQKPKIKWYLIDTEGTFCKVWDLIITLVIIYSLIMTPFVLIFKQIYMTCDKNRENCEAVEPNQKKFAMIELAIEMAWFVEILLNFVKKTRANRKLCSIVISYLFGSFIF